MYALLTATLTAQTYSLHSTLARACNKGHLTRSTRARDPLPASNATRPHLLLSRLLPFLCLSSLSALIHVGKEGRKEEAAHTISASRPTVAACHLSNAGNINLLIVNHLLVVKARGSCLAVSSGILRIQPRQLSTPPPALHSSIACVLLNMPLNLWQ